MVFFCGLRSFCVKLWLVILFFILHAHHYNDTQCLYRQSQVSGYCMAVWESYCLVCTFETTLLTTVAIYTNRKKNPLYLVLNICNYDNAPVEWTSPYLDKIALLCKPPALIVLSVAAGRLLSLFCTRLHSTIEKILFSNKDSTWSEDFFHHSSHICVVQVACVEVCSAHTLKTIVKFIFEAFSVRFSIHT